MPPGQHSHHWQLRLLEQANKIRLMERTIERAESMGVCTKDLCRALVDEEYQKRCIELEALKELGNVGNAQNKPQVLEQEDRKRLDGVEIAPSKAAVQAQESLPHVHSQGSSTPSTIPLAVRYDKDGVPWTAFKWFSGPGQERMEYTMRCDKYYRLPALSPEFKYANTLCTYQLETVKLGWTLAYLNPFLRCGKSQLNLLRAAVNHYKQLEAQGRRGLAKIAQSSRPSNQSASDNCVASQLRVEHMADASGLDSDDSIAGLSCLQKSRWPYQCSHSRPEAAPKRTPTTSIPVPLLERFDSVFVEVSVHSSYPESANIPSIERTSPTNTSLSSVHTAISST